VTRSIEIGGDDRGRVPFALAAVVLLLGSVAYANTLALRGPAAVDTAADDALDRAESAGRPAVRAAATAAARDAARNPVTEPANTSVGRALDPEAPFRDALRLRVSLAAADALGSTGVDAGGVSVTASLPTVESAADVPAAIERVSVEPLANGTAVRVVVRNVTLTARRGGSVVATRRVEYSVAVPVPAFAMHERTTAYESRLNRSPFEGPGLGRALTWRLWAVAQARGTGQYLGAPVTNVLANRHVELSTNAAALRAQRATLGRSDPEGRAALVRATGEVAATDLLTPAMDRGPAWSETVLGRTEKATRADEGSAPTVGTADPAATERAGGDEPLRVGVNATADRAFVRFLDGDGDRGFESAVRGAYRAGATRRVTVLDTDRERRPDRDSPGENWTFVTERVDRSSTIVERDARDTSAPSAVADERRTVAVRHRVTRYWTRDGSVRETTATWTDRYRVRVAVGLSYAPTVGPDGETEPLFVRGGAIDGPNLADLPGDARGELLPPGAADRLARTAVGGEESPPSEGAASTRTTLVGDRPDALDDWIYRDLVGLRERIRNVTVPVSRSAVAAGEANTPHRQAAAIRERRAELIDAPDRYDGVADRARVAARAAYVDAVVAALDGRAAAANDRNDEYLDRIGDLRGEADGRVDELSRIAADATAPEPSPVGRWRAGEVTLTPAGDPGYLPVTEVEAEQIESGGPGDRFESDGTVRPLVARNTNLFTAPTGEAADAVTDAALPTRRTASLASAGRVLVAADRTAGTTGGPDPELREARDDLREAVAERLPAVERAALGVLRRETDLSRAAREDAVDAAAGRWSTPGARALAAANGSYASAVADEAVSRGDRSGIARDRLAVRLRVEVAAAATDTSVAVPPEIRAGTVDETREARREELRRAAKRTASNATERLRSRYGGRVLGRVAAGLPVAPLPGYWYATTNVWDVEVAGAYPRFTVSAPAGGPDGGDGRVRYVRDGTTVTLDVDGDGAAERLGRNERVSFRTWTVVIVVVPAGPSGVGDVDGNADERSPGWPCPSPTAGSRGCRHPPE